MKEVIFFSNNKNKISEISNFFNAKSLRILNLDNYEKIQSPKETGRTFEENAKIKSLYGYNFFKKICFADDSGISIEAMGGKPGVNSKNFLQKKSNPNETLRLILSIVKDANNFNAFFQTSICLSLSKTRYIFFNGIVKGKISHEIKGGWGFGYDPIFIPNNYDRTFAEMSLREKNTISHRSIALKKLKDYFRKLV